MGGAAGLFDEVRDEEFESYRRLLDILEQRAALLELLRGSLDLMVLRTLDAMGPQHGLGLAKRILQASEGLLSQQQGTLYAALLRLGTHANIRILKVADFLELIQGPSV